MLGTYHLTSLFEILNRLHFMHDPDQLWSFILEQASKTVQSEAATYYEVQDDELNLKVRSAYGIDPQRLSEVPFRVGVGICGWVAQYHQPALVPDVRSDNRFNRGVDVMTGFTTKSLLCIPVFSAKRSFGVIEMINRKSGQFGPADQEFMTLLGRQAGIAYQNLLLLKEVQQKEVLLASLLSNLSGGLIAIDRQERITVLNPAAGQLLRLGGQVGPGKALDEALGAYPWVGETLRKTLASKATVSRQEQTLSVGGADQLFGYTTILIADHDKQILGAGIIFQRLH